MLEKRMSAYFREMPSCTSKLAGLPECYERFFSERLQQSRVYKTYVPIKL